VGAAARRLGIDAASIRSAFRARGLDPLEFLGSAPPAFTDTEPVRARAVQHATDTDVRKLQARVVDLEDQLAWVHSAAAHKPEILTPRSRPKSGLRPADPLFMISDTHIGEVVTRAETLGLNEYNLKEAGRRMSKCWDNMLWIRKDMARTQSCDHTYLALNGDIVTGNIHAELRETNEVGLRGQCDFAVEALMPGIIAMADATPGILHVVCIGGNHGRATFQQQIKNGTEHSFEHIGIYDPLRRQIGDRKGKIAWHVPSAERHLFTMHGRRIAQQHGTMIKSQGGIGGTLVPMTRYVVRDAMADLYLFGHFHEADAYGKVLKNGSLIGDSAYSRWIGVDPATPPQQVGCIIDAHSGVRRFERISVL
jgi:predicted phosphodiesterase